MSDALAYLAMPRFGRVDFAAAAAMLSPNDHTYPEGYRVRVVGGSSVDTGVAEYSFNQMWSRALDLRDSGEATHFAMLHSDIEPIDPAWLNRLYMEMVDHHLVAVSAVVPIKNDSGNTSTAIGDEVDPWHVLRYVRTDQRPHLPVTFTGEDVCERGEVLLINTGCLLIDMRPELWDDFEWKMRTRIRRTQRGRVCEMHSEDWEMSYHIHNSGARYGATWSVRLKHHGAAAYRNY